MIRIIDKGSFGEVWLGRIQSVEVAVKIPLVAACREDFIREAQKMHAIWHAQLVQFLGVCTKPQEESVLVITEYMPNGALNKHLQTEEGRNLQQIDLLFIMDQVANGTVYLESIKLVHRDLRAANVFVAKDGRVKVGDFGQSKMLSMPSSCPADLKTPIRWSSPEALINGKEVTSKSDVWQYGILWYEVFSYGDVPYEKYSRRGH
ncbi:tyrosine protein kinase HCK [Echinococcus multilocularis]|uniref:Tyrosine protein kinase HCK n=1 Tax=Echinococcus multilocularis TaxID=6211 RepID=A0A068YKF0_ECHMU|nr:tyrosine protein kinase HCK [Echinococcus multilocularis]